MVLTDQEQIYTSKVAGTKGQNKLGESISSGNTFIPCQAKTTVTSSQYHRLTEGVEVGVFTGNRSGMEFSSASSWAS